MEGLLKTKNKRLLLAEVGNEYWAWDIDKCKVPGKAAMLRGESPPKGQLTLFDVDRPPATVSYIPVLGFVV